MLFLVAPADSNEPDTILPYPFDENQSGGLFGNNPGNITTEVVYDPATNQYLIYKKIGDQRIGIPEVLTPEEYRNRVFNQQGNEYWNRRVEETSRKNTADGSDPRSSTGLIPQIQVGNELFGRIFGGNTIEIKPQGSAELTFGGRYQRIRNPMLSQQNQTTFTFNFDQRIQMNVTGKIGEKLSLSTNYDTEATFAFENRMKVEFKGDEDDIIKSLELGNVSLPVNSSLISGAQSLFGVKGQFQFGKTTVTTVFSEQRSQSQSINVQGGGTTQEFTIWGDEYEANRHFFLAQYFRDHYEEALQQVPLINSPINITRIEVWVTNRRSQAQDTRNILAFMDLGESESNAYRNGNNNLPGYQIFPGSRPAPNGLPDNENNLLAPQDVTSSIGGLRDLATVSSSLEGSGFTNSVEFIELANARKLDPNQYTLNTKLGYISLSQPLNQDEVLAVAFQYTANGRTYQVGEFSNDGINPPKVIITKMLKSAVLDVRTPVWDLMMKNIYSLNAFGVSKENFRLNVMYMNDETGVPIPFLPEGNLSDELLVRVMEMDKVNNNNDPLPDGIFDYIPGITIIEQSGRIIFPVVEPFGSNLEQKLTDPANQDRYVFQELYDSTLFRAQEQTSKNKFLMKGQFQSSSGSEISLNAFNIPRGSVSVTAGGQKLVEGQDFTVDYSLGRVKILNEAILQSGTPIKVNFENNTLFNFQTKTFAGLTFDHRFNDKINIGGTLVHLNEKPLTQKVNLGDEPLSNTMWGLNGTFQDEAPFLTRMVDAIPFIDTKEKSNIQVQGEVAQLVPGAARGIKINGEPTTYIDDFENAQTQTDIRGTQSWNLAATPANQPDLFPEGNISNSIINNYNRAKIAWYTIDPIFYLQNAPQNIKDDPNIISNHYMRQILVEEVFPQKQLPDNVPRNIAMFDIAFYPTERGPYNFDVEGEPGISTGINPDGSLSNPESRWGGITRQMQINNFEQQNIEFIQFWVLDPFLEDPTLEGGDLYFNLGNISEDVLNDGRQGFENGIPVSPGQANQVDTTIYGVVPKVQPLVSAFENTANARETQDVGIDGIPDGVEATFDRAPQGNYLQRIIGVLGQSSQAYQLAAVDPNADNFQFYRGASLDANNADILERYKNFNNPEGNSRTTQVDGFPASSTNEPDKEDVNRDQTLNKTETYFQYKVSMRQEDLQIGKNYITDIRETTTGQLPNGQTKRSRWIQFKIPVFTPDKRVGPINDFRSIRFMRMFLTNFRNPIVLRFARLELVRGEWRRYKFSLDGIREEIPVDGSDQTVFNVNAVNLEENSSRKPVPYVLPPGIDRQVLFGATNLVQQNEQSLSLFVCGLRDGDARAVFKTLNMDMRMYKRLKMFSHAEAGDIEANLKNGDLNLFVRLGSDYDQNYYEYELPLTVTPWGVSNTDDDIIWPTTNDVDIDLEILKEVKLERDRVVNAGTGFTRQNKYSVLRDGRVVSVVGSPNLSNVRTIMIGIRNPKKRSVGDPDDGMAKCAEVWVNELRLTGYDNRGGWAANARVTAKLADFGNVSLSGYYSSVGFGSLDQTINERNKFSQKSYDLQTNFELGKFFGSETGLRIPLFFSFAEEWKTPQFNPLDPDIEFDDALNNLNTEGQRDSLRKASEDYVNRRSINFTNVRKERRGGSSKQPMPWDIENFAASYSFSEVFRRNINTEFDRRVDHRGSLTYAYQTRPENVQPFKGIKSDYLALIRDINFYYLPKQFSVKAEMARTYGEAKQRNTDNFYFELPTTYDKQWTFNRSYNLNWDFTKSLRLDYQAQMKTWIDEVAGPADTDSNQAKIREGLDRWGRPVQYNQNTKLNWQVPINKLPFMDFANLIATYDGTYAWQAPSRRAQDPTSPVYFANTIQNARTLSLNGNFNFLTLYNKSKYLREINSPQPQRKAPPARMRPPAGESAEAEEDKEDDRSKPSVAEKVAKAALRVVMLVRSASVNFSQNDGTSLPGFIPEPSFMGTTGGGQYNYAPGWDYVFGDQVDIRSRAARNNWLVSNPNQNQFYSQVYTRNWGYNVTLEPIADLRVDLRGTYTQGENLQALFIDTTGVGDDFRSYNEMITGNFTVSFMSISTAFETTGDAESNFQSDAFDQFKANRLIISERLAQERAIDDPNYVPNFIDEPDSSRYGYEGYSVSSPDVLIPAFRAAYGGNDAGQISLDPFTGFAIPNWNLNYTGLMKLEWFRKTFTSFTLNHSYRSNYSIGNYQTNLERQQLIDDGDLPINPNGDFIPQYQYSQVSITEQFGPLIGFNMRMKNNTTFQVNYNKDRRLSLSLTNNQLTETKGSTVTFGAGYILKDVKFNFIRLGANRRAVSSNLELKADVSIQDNITVIRQILEGTNQASAGQRVIIVGVSADYQISSRITARVFYDHNVSTFKTSNAFPTTTGNGGVSIRLNLGQ
ncbi:MAG: cell surface protein SprA [Bacteroidota bacterium]|nr:cell surface protein SprA [Bacteroidota bacterium]MDX5506296.1 cell surface protein SprA [Bacteroidota bacterium]